ncbi:MULTISPECIES: Dabb family protein [unclassified Modestobacter]
MFQHIGMLTLIGTATAADADSIADGLLALPGVVPGLERAEVSRDGGLGAGNAALHFRMVFAEQADWEGYRSHPAHLAVITERIAPVLASKVFVQVPEGASRVATAGPTAEPDA